MLAFQQYQTAFTAHIRDPQAPRPHGVRAKHMAVYREIVLNNFIASVSACFPVLLGILGKRRFATLARLCFAQQPFTSPLFRDLPLALVDFLQRADLAALALPVFSAQLAHYEWAELHVSQLPGALSNPSAAVLSAESLLQRRLSLNPAHLLLAYDYPVHLLSKRYQPVTPDTTYLVLARQADFSVTFIQLNALTYLLLQQWATQSQSGNQALQGMIDTLKHPQPAQLLQFGADTLLRLHQQHVLMLAD